MCLCVCARAHVYVCVKPCFGSRPWLQLQQQLSFPEGSAVSGNSIGFMVQQGLLISCCAQELVLWKTWHTHTQTQENMPAMQCKSIN